jgi:3-oxoacyl-[acyl-carrier-protein] synthase-3
LTRTRSIFRGVGGYLPQRVMSNDEMATLVDTSDEWIRKMTGIGQRHVASEGEASCYLETSSSLGALADAGLTIADIDLIVVATTTPDLTYPATAALVQDKLGMHHGTSYDIQAF